MGQDFSYGVKHSFLNSSAVCMCVCLDVSGFGGIQNNLKMPRNRASLASGRMSVVIGRSTAGEGQEKISNKK